MAGVGHLKRIWTDAFRVAGAVQETCASEISGFCVTGAALWMTWHHFCVAGASLDTDGVENSQNALVQGRQLCTQLSIFEN